MPIERNSSEQLPSPRQKRERPRRQSRIDGRAETDNAITRRQIIVREYMRHLKVWELIAVILIGMSVAGLFFKSGGGATVGLADIGSYAGLVIFVAPVGALISWGVNRTLKSIFASKDIM